MNNQPPTTVTVLDRFLLKCGLFISKEALETLLAYIFIAFFADIFVFGADQFLTSYGIPLKKIIFLVFCVISLAASTYRSNTEKKFFRIILCAWAIFFFIWGALIPFMGTQPSIYSARDLLPWAAILIYYPSRQYLSKPRAQHLITLAAAFFILTLALVHIALFLLGLIEPQMAYKLSEYLKAFMERPNFDIETSVFFSIQENLMPRIYFVSSCLLLIGLYIGTEISKRRFLLGAFYSLIIIVAIYCTQTRSLYLSSFLYYIILAFFTQFRNRFKNNIQSLFALLALPFLLSFAALFFLDPQFIKMVGMARGFSDNLRYMQLIPLINAFKEHLIWGNGFGMSIEPVRSSAAPFSYELSILALIAKVGLFGFLVSLFLTALTLFQAQCRTTLTALPINFPSIYALYFAFIFASTYNPYIFGFNGTFFFLFILYAYQSSLEKRDVKYE